MRARRRCPERPLFPLECHDDHGIELGRNVRSDAGRDRLQLLVSLVEERPKRSFGLDPHWSGALGASLLGFGLLASCLLGTARLPIYADAVVSAVGPLYVAYKVGCHLRGCCGSACSQHFPRLEALVAQLGLPLFEALFTAIQTLAPALALETIPVGLTFLAFLMTHFALRWFSRLLQTGDATPREGALHVPRGAPDVSCHDAPSRRRRCQQL